MPSLLLGAKPKTCIQCPKVRLGPGRWAIVTEGVVDSILAVCDDRTPSEHCNLAVNTIVTGPTNIQLLFLLKGSEDCINAYAVQLKD
jgi:hypothetical protein